MAEARRRALEQFGVELEHEVEFLGAARAAAAAVGAAVRRGETPPRAPARLAASRARAPPSSTLPALERAPVVRFAPVGPLAARRLRDRARRASALYLLARDDADVRRADDRGRRRSACGRRARRARARAARGAEPARAERGRGRAAPGRAPRRRGRSYDRSFPHTLRVTVRPEHPVAVARRGPKAWLVVGERARDRARSPLGTHPELPRIWLAHSGEPQVGASPDATGSACARCGRSALARTAGFRGRVRMVRVRGARPDASCSARASSSAWATLRAVPLKLAIAERIVPGCSRRAATATST